MQETVNGVTFDPSTLFFVLVGVDTEGEPFQQESWHYPQPTDYAHAVKRAKAMLNRASLGVCVRIHTYISEKCSIRVATIWRGDE